MGRSSQPKIVVAESVRQALLYAQKGDAEAALVGRAIASVPEVRSSRSIRALRPDRAGAGDRRRLATARPTPRQFAQFVLGEEGQAILKEFGFKPADRRGPRQSHADDPPTHRREAHDMNDLGPFWLSLRVAALATLLIVAVGLPAGAGSWRGRDFPGKGLVAGLLVLPLVLPPTVLGYYLLQVLGRRRCSGTGWSRRWGSRWSSTGRAR